jgi:hypothetical protein
MTTKAVTQKRMTALARTLAGSAVVIGSLALGWSAPAQAQSVCLPHAEVVKRLEAQFGEVPVAVGLGRDGRLVEVFAAADGATWTLAVVLPNGMSCVVADGEHWQPIPKLVNGPGA